VPDPDAPVIGDSPVRPDSGVQVSGHAERFTNPVRLRSVDSTNRYVRDEALAGAPEGLVVVAEEQTEGRGRRGRSWAAPRGSSLLCSMLFRPALAPGELHLLPSVVGLAALDAALAVAGVDAGLKWPNDVLVGEAKLAGILGELVGTGNLGTGPVAAVVGIGMNVAWPPGWPPPGPLAELTARATTLERAAGRPLDQEALLLALCSAVERRYRTLETAEGRAATSAEYRERCVTIGREVKVLLDGETVEGSALDFDDDGRLVVALRDGARRSFDAGDVVHLR
jgi:BirA family biotin operon repressor/biotin-[acetyl-CoA-carboxylase] ligase